jgi:hypothetical protein
MSEKDIKKVFEKYKATGEFPPFYPFTEPGDSIWGRVINTRPSQFSTEEKPQIVYDIRTIDGEEYSLPTSTVAMSKYESLKVSIGDYVEVTYKGEVKSKKGRLVKDYDVSKIPAEEFEKLFPDKKVPLEVKATTKVSPIATIEPQIKNDYKKLTEAGVLSEIQIVQALCKKYNIKAAELKTILQQEKPQQIKEAEKIESTTITIEKKPEQEEEKSTAIQEARKLLNDVLDFYDEIDEKRLSEILKTADISLTPEQVISACSDFLVVDKGIIKKK